MSSKLILKLTVIVVLFFAFLFIGHKADAYTAKGCQCSFNIGGVNDVDGYASDDALCVHTSEWKGSYKYRSLDGIPPNIFLYDDSGNASISARKTFEDLPVSVFQYMFNNQLCYPMTGQTIYMNDGSATMQALFPSTNPLEVRAYLSRNPVDVFDEEMCEGMMQSESLLAYLDLEKKNEANVNRQDIEGNFYVINFRSCWNVTIEIDDIPPSSSSGDGYEGVEFSLPSEAKDLNKIGDTNLSAFVGRGIKTVLGVSGTMALVIFIYGGVMWMTAGGNPERSTKSLKILMWAGLGAIVMLASYAIVDFVFEAFRP